jgi:hypothetical protein
MTDLIERSEVERVLRDPAFVVPEAEPAATRPVGRFRSLVSRFSNGPAHDDRRRRLLELLDELDPAALAAGAKVRTRAMNAADADEIAAHVPVATLADRLGFPEPDATPAAAAAIASHYLTGEPSTSADAAVTRLLAMARRHDHDDHDTVLRVQLLVQAHAATSRLITTALRRRRRSVDEERRATSDLLAAVLRDTPPVQETYRISPDGETVALRFDGPDSAAPEHPRTLAFGAGPRACPARSHAMAIATAVVDGVGEC